MAVPFPSSLERTLDSDVSHHHELQDGDIKGNARSKNIIPGKVNGLQEGKPKWGVNLQAIFEQKPTFFFFRAFFFFLLNSASSHNGNLMQDVHCFHLL